MPYNPSNKLPIGTKTKNKKTGYVNVKVGLDHPLANASGWTSEHWLVWWKANGKTFELAELMKKEKVSIHHKNGIRDDNRPCNLELMLPGKHPTGWRLSDLFHVIETLKAANPSNKACSGLSGTAPESR